MEHLIPVLGYKIRSAALIIDDEDATIAFLQAHMSPDTATQRLEELRKIVKECYTGRLCLRPKLFVLSPLFILLVLLTSLRSPQWQWCLYVSLFVIILVVLVVDNSQRAQDEFFTKVEVLLNRYTGTDRLRDRNETLVWTVKNEPLRTTELPLSIRSSTSFMVRISNKRPLLLFYFVVKIDVVPNTTRAVGRPSVDTLPLYQSTERITEMVQQHQGSPVTTNGSPSTIETLPPTYGQAVGTTFPIMVARPCAAARHYIFENTD